MKERPILFSAPMVRAILDGNKTQTRRVCKPANESALSYVAGPFDCPELGPGHFGDEDGDLQFLCPYGQPGDRLWVRETWRGLVEISEPNAIKPEYFVARHVPDQRHCRRVEYAATQARDGEPWRPSIHMPRWASRILLEIVSVRVERLNAISNQDAKAEGVMPLYAVECANAGHPYNAIPLFRMLWAQINGADSWDANPWVWVVEFKRVTL